MRLHQAEAAASKPALIRRPFVKPSAGSAEHGLLDVQARAGNRAALAWLSHAQAKLVVGPADDEYEAEADRVARQVVDRLGQADSTSLLASTTVQRRAEVGRPGGPLDGPTEQAIDQSRGSGRQLDPTTRAQMEDAFGGADFGAVRIHSGTEASDLNERIAARAFTVGSDIFFHGPAPDTTSRTGQELLAHELTHTIQQGAAPVRRRQPTDRVDGEGPEESTDNQL